MQGITGIPVHEATCIHGSLPKRCLQDHAVQTSVQSFDSTQRQHTMEEGCEDSGMLSGGVSLLSAASSSSLICGEAPAR